MYANDGEFTLLIYLSITKKASGDAFCLRLGYATTNGVAGVESAECVKRVAPIARICMSYVPAGNVGVRLAKLNDLVVLDTVNHSVALLSLSLPSIQSS